ncbi:hypothetical protein [Mucilaginibacter arboris]|uniref:Zf-HC2 domain-containing protein n=1 Tax=Mucilaginibacter arboris TaxID=2682090 RepID=A0A7K1SSP1_9SPHI|nr:hypothetical protein [Mucilaginibacter arboris]MVN20120.1 hypothetical protein [Mucilaginibacter arboris]
MNEIEEKLWNYIDGFCTEEEQKTISQRIEKDENYRRKYAELLAFQENINAIDLEEPSMGFTFKVMENIRSEQARVPLKTHINHRIIGVIAAFFIFSILLLLGYIFANISWSHAVAIKLPQINLPAVNSYLNPVVIKGFLFFDVVLGLFFLDHYFRKWFFEKK